MTIVRVLFPGLWETSWPKYVWFRKMNVYTLNSLHYLSNQQHLLRPRYSFVGCGAGGQRVAVWVKRQLTLQTTTYNTKSTIDDSYKILFGEPVGWGGGGVCMSLWLYENWECLILAYMCDVGGYDCVTDIPTFSIPSPILAHQKPLTYVPLPPGVFSASKNCISACRLGKQLSHFAHLRPLFAGFS